MSEFENIYQSTPVAYDDIEDEELELASPWKRIGAYLINVIIGMVVYIPLIVGAYSMYGSAAALESEDVSNLNMSGYALGMVGLGVVLIIAYLILQAVLMSKTGQSLGKRILKIKVVDENGDNPGFVGTVVMREFVPNLILTVLGLIPFVGGLVQFGFWGACLVMLFLVDRNRQTLQDMIAKTYVVEAE